MNADRVPIAQLKKRYGHRKFYAEYVPILGIEIQKEGRNGYISTEAATLLEKYHEARGKGEVAKQEFLNSLQQTDIYEAEISALPLIESPKSALTKRITSERVGSIDLVNSIGDFENSSPVKRWLIADLIFRSCAINQTVIPRRVLLILIEAKRLPPLKEGSFSYQGFLFRQTSPNRKEWQVFFLQ